ncbi:DUF427 domain-containing protein [Saccharothrix longispora]|uniref:DUF427 domain-containing protein n=1 Tax=Saccharothrix longispora TaxID=33920 RepID=UPI0028FD8A45|nr:DUF427 domain-containing protein [Saccharothrix longispora]MDU0290909.1 DUF427 domain-containing protein [Saccharothrix longispora]
MDALAGSRHVRGEVAGVEVANSVRPVILCETGLPPRHHLPLTAVRRQLPRPSDLRTRTWPGATGPAAGERPRAGLVAFHDEVDTYVDGVLQERPRTHFG